MSQTRAHPQSRRRHGLRAAPSASDGAGDLPGNCRRSALQVTDCWPDLPPDALSADFVFFDVDLGFDEQFPWKPGEAPMPLVALIGSEAPGRIEWALFSHKADAQLLKPVGNAGVYSALLIARQSFEERKRLAAEIAALEAPRGRAPDDRAGGCGACRQARSMTAAMRSCARWRWAGRSASRKRRAASWRWRSRRTAMTVPTSPDLPAAGSCRPSRGRACCASWLRRPLALLGLADRGHRGRRRDSGAMADAFRSERADVRRADASKARRCRPTRPSGWAPTCSAATC